MTAKPAKPPRKRFKPPEVEDLLVACHRRCCVCHRFCGVKIEVHHIEGRDNNDIDNAIPLCFDCHAEVELYNPDHPLGKSFSAGELKKHRDNWKEMCRDGRLFSNAPSSRGEVGPLEGLIHEIEFNRQFVQPSSIYEVGAFFEVSQFNRAMQEGVFSYVRPDVRSCIFDLYKILKQKNASVQTVQSVGLTSTEGSKAAKQYMKDLTVVTEKLKDCADTINSFLGA